ncbi:M48 family metalloprotease [Halocatena halophila]|uniref:M48 family metalloprotease n=1 Tax=Halocatena halophila TaxID=2814576 RepID=UPI002ED38A7B
MAILVFLIVVANLAFVTLVVELASPLFILGFVLLPGDLIPGLFAEIRLLIIPVTVVFMWWQYRYFLRDVLGSEMITTDVEPVEALEAKVTRLGAQTAIAPPSVAIIDSSVPNCYTIGRRSNATIVVSTALVQTLSDAEIEAVLAHELSHVLNRDATVMTMAVAPFWIARRIGRLFERYVKGIVYVAISIFVLSQIFLITFGLGGELLSRLAPAYDWFVSMAPLVGPGPVIGEIPSVTSPDAIRTVIDIAVGLMMILFYGGVLLLPVVIGMGIYYVILGIIPRQLSVYREFAADRGAVLLLGEVSPLASALQTLSDADNRPPDDLRTATELATLCFISDGIVDTKLTGSTSNDEDDQWYLIDRLSQHLPTAIVAHPSIELRLTRLQAMDRTVDE